MYNYLLAMSVFDVTPHATPARNTTMSSMDPLDNVVVLWTVHTAAQKNVTLNLGSCVSLQW
jgi:hypothetical protein